MEMEDANASPLEIMRSMQEFAQICHFCSVFRSVIHMPIFSRSDLEFSFLHPENEFKQPNPLLAEIHYKLCKNYGGHKTEKIFTDWKTTLVRRVHDRWRRSFDFNPLKDTLYEELSLREKIQILKALCDWKVEDSNEVNEFIEAQKDEGNDDLLNPKPIGRDDAGNLYWYFGDECWVYSEVDLMLKPVVKRSYRVAYSSPRHIRIGIEFTEDHKSPAAVSVPERTVEQIVTTTINELVDNVVELCDDDPSDESEESSESDDEMDVEPAVQRRSSRRRSRVNYAEDGPRRQPQQQKRDSSEEDVSDDEEELVEEEFIEIQCDDCQLIFDPWSLDPPITTQPDEWKCMDCLVTSARGFSRRRSSRAATPIRTSSRRAKEVAQQRLSGRRSPKPTTPKKPKVPIELIDPVVALDRFLEHKKRLRDIEWSRLEQLPDVPIQTAPWRVVSSNLTELKHVVANLEGGSRYQATLRTKLNRVLRTTNDSALARERKRNHQHMLLIMPRRQSSRVARSTIRSMAEQELDNEVGTTRRSTRSRRYNLDEHLSPEEREQRKKDAHVADRAARANRRMGTFPVELEDFAAPVVESTPPPPPPPIQVVSMELGNWIDWERLRASNTQLRDVCFAIVDRLNRDDRSIPFSRPVNPQLDGCIEYFKYIKQPMDLGTVRSRVMTGYYKSWASFQAEMQLIWSNCRFYNGEEALITQYANTLADACDRMYLESEQRGATAFNDQNDSSSSSSESDSEDSDL